MRMYNPPHPGEIIKEFWIDDQHISISDLARHLDTTPSTVSRLVNGKSDISPEMALKLSKVLGKSPETWLEMQSQYSLWQASKRVNLNALIPLSVSISQ